MGGMNATELLDDLALRPVGSARGLPTLTPEQLNAHLADHPNSIAWLLWHSGREVDVQLTELSGAAPVWERYRDRFGLGELGESFGFGHTREQAAAVRVDDQDLLIDYLGATLAALKDYALRLSDAELDEVIDDSWDPPVTRGVRLVSIIDDAIAHVGQAAYAAGALTQWAD